MSNIKVDKRYACMCYQMYSPQIQNNCDVTCLKDFAVGTRVTDISMALSGNQMVVISKDQKGRDVLKFFEAQKLPDAWYVSINWMMNLPLKSVSLTEEGPYITASSENSFLSFLIPNPFDGVVRTDWMKRFAFSPLRSIASSNSGTTVLAGCEDGTLFAYQPHGEQRWKCALGSSVEALSISADGSSIVAGCRDGALLGINSSGEILEEYQYSSPVQSLALSPDGKDCAVGYEDGHVLFFENDLKDPARSFDRNEPPCGISYSKNGEMIFLWSPDECTLVHQHDIVWNGHLSSPSGSQLPIRCARISPDGKFFVAAVSDGDSELLKFYSITTHQEKSAWSEARSVFATGITLYKQGKYDGALSLFTHAENLVGPSLRSTFSRGEALYKNNDTKSALELFQKCLAYEKSEDRETLMMMGIAALHLKKENKALDLFKNAASLVHNDSSVQYALTMTQYLANNREGTCPPPLGDCMVAGLPIDLSPFIVAPSAKKYEKCFLMPCRGEALEQVTRSGIYVTQVQKGIDAGYNIKKGDIGIVIDVIDNRLIGVFEAAGFPQTRRPIPGNDPIEFVRSKKNVLSIRLQKPKNPEIIEKASEILKSIKTEILMTRDGEPYITRPLIEGDVCANVLYYFGLAERAVRYPKINDIVQIVKGDLAGAKACVKEFDQKQGTVTIELCDVTIAVPIVLKREMITWDGD
jgi:tetratricopeptide (TPR) repeat protein